MTITESVQGTRRDQLTIMGDLLVNIQEPRRLTHLLYRSNMSYSQLVRYLDTLIEMGLIDEQKKPFRSFSITDDGKAFMNIVKKSTLIPAEN